MKSVILQGLKNLCSATCDIYETSKVKALVEKIYTKVSTGWNFSGIVNSFRKQTYEKVIEESLISKIIYFPFSVLEYINKKVGEKLLGALEKSAIIDMSKSVINGFLALNTRFLGCILAGMMISHEVISRDFSVVTAVIGIVAVLMILINLNITGFFAGSKILEFVLSFVGYSDLKWDFYDKERAGKVSTMILGAILGLVFGVLPIKLGILAPVAIAGAGTVLMYPIVGMFCAVFAAPFVPTMILAGLCVLTIGSVVIKSLTEKDFRWKRDGVGVGLGFLVVLLMISSVFSFDPKKSILVWGMYLIFIGFYYAIVSVVKTKEQVYGLLRVFAIAGLFVAFYGVLQYIFKWNVKNAWIDADMFNEATMRAYSTMENPNVLGEYLLLLIPISAMLFLKKGTGVKEILLYLATFCIGALCMVFTQSRGCWLGLILAAAIFASFYNGRLWALLPFAVAALLFFLPESMMDRFMSVGNLEDSSTSYRVFIWLGTFDLLKDFWVGGIGMGEGAFGKVYPLYSYKSIIAPHSHNTFLQLLVEGGIVTLLTFLGVMVMFLKSMVSVFDAKDRCGADSLTALALGSAVSGFLLQSMFDYTFYNYRMMAMFFMIIAIGISLKHIKEAQNV